MGWRHSVALLGFSALATATACDSKSRQGGTGATVSTTASAVATPSAASASSESSSPPPATSASGLPPVAQGTHAEMGPSDGDWTKWIRARVANAKAGQREIVRGPVARKLEPPCGGSQHERGRDPDVLLSSWSTSDSAATSGGGVLAAQWGPGTAPPHVVDAFDVPEVEVVEGWFTGDTTRQNACEAFGFHVMRSRRATATVPNPPVADFNPPVYEDDAQRVQVLLSAPESLRELPLLTDDRRWLAIVATLPLVEADVDAHAENTRAELASYGFDTAEIVDTRQAAAMFCCYRVVVAGRFATQGAAQATVTKAKRFYPAAYVRKGF
jgi:hypothetical protein